MAKRTGEKVASTGSATGSKDNSGKLLTTNTVQPIISPSFNDGTGMLLRARVLFERSSAFEVHFTSDGTAFYQAEHAAIHSENLADNKIVTIKREEIE